MIEHLEEGYDEPDRVNSAMVNLFVHIEDEDGDDDFVGAELGIDEDNEIVIQPDEALTQASESFEAEVDYTKMTVKQLKVELKARGLKLSGKKAVLLERLRLDIVEGGDWENPDKVDYEKDIREQQDAYNEIINCSWCYEIIGTAEAMDGGHVEWNDINGEIICGACNTAREIEGDQDLDPHYTPFYAESSMPSGEVLTDAEVPPMLFEQYIPPEVWNHISDSDKEEYIRTEDEGLLSCPDCGFTKADLRTTNGFCFATDASSPVYDEDASCPYSKMFAPLHWIEPKNVYSEGFEDAVIDKLYTNTEGHSAESAITLNTPEDFVKTHTITISKELYGEIGDDLPESVSINYSKDGSKVILGYFDSDKRFIENISGMESGKNMEAEDNENAFSAEEMLRAESDRRKQFYVQALDNIGADFEAEDDDDDELGNMGPFTHLENNAESFGAEEGVCSSCNKHAQLDDCTKCGDLICLGCTSQNANNGKIQFGKEIMEFLCPSCVKGRPQLVVGDPPAQLHYHRAESVDIEDACVVCEKKPATEGYWGKVVCESCAYNHGRGHSKYKGASCGACGYDEELHAYDLMRCDGCHKSMCSECPGDKQLCSECSGLNAESVEFHEEELYTQGDEDICVNCNGVGGRNVWIGNGSIVCNTCKYELAEQYDMPSEEVEKRLFSWDSGTMAEAPTSVKQVEKKDNNNLLFGLLALGAGIAVIAPNQIKRIFGK